METCIVCNQDVEKNNITLYVKGKENPSNKIEILANVCPNCGVLMLTGAGASFINLLSTGFPEATEEDLNSIDLDTIFNEMMVPGKDPGEKIKWIDPKDLANDPYEAYYQEIFKDGLPAFLGKYKRLIHFLNMDSEERIEAFGPFRCSSLRILPTGHINFREGRSRFLLFRYLGAKRIPVAISDEYEAEASRFGIPLYDSKE